MNPVGLGEYLVGPQHNIWRVIEVKGKMTLTYRSRELIIGVRRRAYGD